MHRRHTHEAERTVRTVAQRRISRLGGRGGVPGPARGVRIRKYNMLVRRPHWLGLNAVARAWPWIRGV